MIVVIYELFKGVLYRANIGMVKTPDINQMNKKTCPGA